MEDTRILWKRLDVRGTDACRLVQLEDGWKLSGCAAYAEDQEIAALAYHVYHDTQWITKDVEVSGWFGAQSLQFQITRNNNGIWWVNGEEVPAVAGCVDVDLGFTPATNTTAIRRLQLAVGGRAEANAAWLDTGDWSLKPLLQCYQKQSASCYLYTSPDNNFQTTLQTNAHGLVTKYPGIWASSG